MHVLMFCLHKITSEVACKLAIMSSSLCVGIHRNNHECQSENCAFYHSVMLFAQTASNECIMVGGHVCPVTFRPQIY
jgi:hypothetical protein